MKLGDARSNYLEARGLLCADFPTGATHGADWEKPKLFQEIVTDFFEKPFKKPSTIESNKECRQTKPPHQTFHWHYYVSS